MAGYGPAGDRTGESAGPVLRAGAFRHYIDFFNSMVEEGVVQHIPDARAWEWLASNIPLFECPDPVFEQTWYYRCWSYRKHIKETPRGFIVTEFLRPVKHAAEYNAISCAFGHHLAEGRWLHDQTYLDDYLRFWLRAGGGLHPQFHQYSGWAAHAAYERWLVHRDDGNLADLLDPLVLDYRTWERERLLDSGLFWQYDVRDGMEESISGSRTAKNARPTINSYMYGNARAIERIASLNGRTALREEYEAKAAALRRRILARLWDEKAGFFKPLLASGGLADVREEIGFIPWMFGVPEPGKGYERAWAQLMNPGGFYAPFGPTTAERRHPGLRISLEGDDCQWNGPSWPFATSQTLKALANVLQSYPQDAVSRRDYFETLRVYTYSHRIRLEDGREIPWVDENLNPFTGEWLARLIKIRKGRFDGRGDHYNHSTYCDLIITGLAGLRPRADDRLEVRPLLPAGTWDWFCLDRVKYHGRLLTILWDRTGRKYGRGKGLRVFVDGSEAGRSGGLEPVCASLPVR
ncbi:MAG: hypothetical protein HXY20_02575 [Acidobacteria bacterium]|nr:hypothetical protein [Acidobacteriota bacterium]